MIKKLLQHSIRALSRQKIYVLLNVTGLSLALSCSFIIGLFIQYELSFDQYHEHKNSVYRVNLHGKISGQEIKVTSTASAIGPAMVREFPEVKDFLRINNWSETVIQYEDQYFIEEAFFEADSSFFEFFSIPLLRGSSKTVLSEPYTVVLSETTVKKIFGKDDPIDKMIRIGTSTSPYRVTGIMEDIADNTHFHANMIGSFITNPRSADENWLNNSFSTYVFLYPGSDPSVIDSRFQDMIIKHVGPELFRYLGIRMEDFLSQGNKYNLFLQSLTDIHLNPSIENELKPANDPRYLRIFGAIGILILLVGGINFMNLATAQATRRAREVGIKKVSGSSRTLLIVQFISETVIMAFLALLMALVITELALPYINTILNMGLKVNYISWVTLPVMILLSLIIGILAGSYPAFYLSSFNPIRVLKGRLNHGQNQINLRTVLTGIQFMISIILIVGTLIMHRQLNFLLSKELGFDKEHVLVIRRAAVIGDKINSFKNELNNLPGVVSVSASTAVPGRSNNNNGYTLLDRPEESFILQTTWVDYDFLETYGIRLSQGRFFDKEYQTDVNAALINERAVRNLSIENPLEAKFSSGDDDNLHVIGVVRDYHFESLRTEIGSCILRFKNEGMNWGYINVRLSPVSRHQTIESISKIWKEYASGDPMIFFFIDEDFQRLYKEEDQNASLSVIFTLLAIIVASLGLYGLTAFTVAQRTKEIGVRKTFGASVTDIWLKITSEIMVLIAVSAAIAWPLIYWVADNWLQNYHYRISLSPLDFFLGFFIALSIALLTMSYRILKAANINPSISLRYE